MRDQGCCDAGPNHEERRVADRGAERHEKRDPRHAVGDRGGPRRAPAEPEARRDQKRHFERRQRDDRVDEEPNLATPGHRCYSRATGAPDEWLVKGRFSTTTRQLSQPA